MIINYQVLNIQKNAYTESFLYRFCEPQQHNFTYSAHKNIPKLPNKCAFWWIHQLHIISANMQKHILEKRTSHAYSMYSRDKLVMVGGKRLQRDHKPICNTPKKRNNIACAKRRSRTLWHIPWCSRCIWNANAYTRFRARIATRNLGGFWSEVERRRRARRWRLAICATLRVYICANRYKVDTRGDARSIIHLSLMGFVYFTVCTGRAVRIFHCVWLHTAAKRLRDPGDFFHIDLIKVRWTRYVNL